MTKKWKKKEINDYQTYYKQDERFGPVYLSAGIPTNEPHRRVEYLMEKLNISKKRIIKLAKEECEGTTNLDQLSVLEELAIRHFF